MPHAPDPLPVMKRTGAFRLRSPGNKYPDTLHTHGVYDGAHNTRPHTAPSAPEGYESAHARPSERHKTNTVVFAGRVFFLLPGTLKTFTLMVIFSTQAYANTHFGQIHHTS